MSHIYQPVMLRTLLAHSGKATIRRIAAEFLPETRASLSTMDKVCWPATTSSSEIEIRIASNRISVS